MIRKTEKIYVLASIIVIYTIYLGILVVWLQAALAGRSHNSLYYDALSRAFLKGQLHLLAAPSPTLLSLADPYDPLQNRLEALDVSLYEGKLYLYWGPVPAVLLACVHVLVSRPIPDAFLVWFFLCGLLIANVSILLWIKCRLFDDLPVWFTILGVFLLGLSHPIPWLLGRPVIYEAAIAGAQFFLMTGVYWLLTSLAGPIPNSPKLFLAGLFWAFALGTRISLLPAVFFVVVCSAWLIYLKRPIEHQRFFNLLAGLVSPMAIMLGFLGLYNYFRFDSFAEFGVHYAMSGFNIHELSQQKLITSLSYMVPAFYNYLFLPFGRSSKEYPFVHLLDALNPAYVGPAFQFEYMIGILWSVPFVVFSVLPVAFGIIYTIRSGLLWNKWGAKKLLGMLTVRELEHAWIPCLFGGLAFFGFFPLLIYFFLTMRFQADFMPALIMLSIFGFGIALRALSNNPQQRKILIMGAVFLAVLSIGLGIHFGLNSSFLQYCLYEPSASCNY